MSSKKAPSSGKKSRGTRGTPRGRHSGPSRAVKTHRGAASHIGRNALIIILAMVVIGVVCYALALRFLVPREESGLGYAISDVKLDNGDEAAGVASGTEGSQMQAGISTADLVSQTDAPVITDTSYRSANIDIKITSHHYKKSAYYVADIKLSTVKALRCAFAKGKFGRNITQNTSRMAIDNNALVAANGDFYGIRNNGIIIRNGVLYRNKPTPRDLLVIYLDGHMEVLDERKQDGYKLIEAGAWQTYSFGPALVRNGVAVGDYSKSNVKGYNPRTGIGMIEPNHFLLVVVDGRAKGYSDGLKIDAFAQLMESLGCQVAYNLDGGATSSMYFNNEIINNALGKSKPREHSDIIMVVEQ